MSNPVQRLVEEIQGQWVKRLQELSIIILLLLIPIFVEDWFGTFVVDLKTPSTLLSFNVIMLIVSIVFFISIVWYFWRLRNTPQFHILFIEHKEEQKQRNKKQFLASFLIPVGISIGLSITILSYGLYTCYWPYWHKHTNWLSPELVPLSFYPLIVVVFSSIVLYNTYGIKPERVWRGAPSLLFTPLILSIFIELLETSTVANRLWHFFQGTPFKPGINVTTDIWFFVFRAVFVTSLIVLLYLMYRINVEHMEISTLATEKYLRGVIEKGVGILPKRVHVGDSHSISLDLTLSKDFVSTDHLCKCSDYLEAELQAVGLKVDGEKRLRICETSPLLITGWNCIFPSSGTHTMNLMINVVKRDSSRSLIFMQEHAVKVEGFLSGSGGSILALLTPFFLTIIQFLLHLKTT